MKSQQLIINNVVMDLPDQEVIALTLQVFEPGQYSVLSNRSNNISLPKTLKNLAALGFANRPMSADDVVYQRIETMLYYYGIRKEGFVIINNIDERINLTFYFGNFDFLKTLGDKKLTDLSLSEALYKKLWNVASMVDSRTNTTTIKWNLIDWHSDSPNAEIDNISRTINVAYFLPAIFVKSVLDMILVESGYEIAGTVMSDVILNKLLLTVRSNFTKQTAETDPPEYEEIPMDDNSVGTHQINIPNGVDTWVQLLTRNSYLMLWGFPNANPALGVHAGFTINNFGKYRFVLESSMMINGFSGDDRIQFLMVRDDDPTGATPLWQSALRSYPMGGKQEEVDEFTLELEPEVGYVWLKAYVWTAGAVTFDILKETKITWFFEGVRASVGMYFPISPNLPDISQAEFFKTILLLFSCFITTDEKNVSIKTFEEIIELTADDWSDIFVDVVQIEFDPNMSQKNWMRYEQDDPDIKEQADASIDIVNNSLDIEQDYINLPFANSEMVVRLDGQDLPRIKLFTDLEPDNEPKPRILIDNIISVLTGTPITIQDKIGLRDPPFTSDQDISTNIPECYFYKTGYDGLSWAELKERSFTAFEAMLNNYKRMRIRIIPSVLHIKNLDQLKPKYFKQLGGNYIILSIDNWQKGRITECEIIKIR